MSNLPFQSAGSHNDDTDDRNSPTNSKLTSINSRITSRSILKRQQFIETRIANNQACDEIHDLQPKYSAIKKMNNENPLSTNFKANVPSTSTSSHELMQGNYYDRTRFDTDFSLTSSNHHRIEPGQIDINIDDYKDCKKKYTPISTSENSSNKDRSSSPPFGDTSESIQQSIAQSAGRLLELNKHQQNSMKNTSESDARTVVHHFSNDNHDDPQRSLSPSSSSECSTDDSSTSNKCLEDIEKSNIPYEKLLNDEDEEEEEQELNEQPSKLLGESSTLLNKHLSQTYGTQSTTTERGKCISTNGYNSHGSSITTKSSSDNSGSIRTNSGSDNDEESDEEHYNNSTASNNSLSICPQTNDSSIHHKKFNDMRFSSEGNNYPSGQSNSTPSDQIENKDKAHLQVPRLKQLLNDDSNENPNQLNSTIDHNLLPPTSKRSTQQSSIQQTNTSFASSQQNRNHLEQQQQTSNLSRNPSRQHQPRPTKKRKQSQQDIIRTELIPGHRGDRDVDELVMFIDGNSVPLQSTDTNKPRMSSKINSLNDPNSNKTSSRKKSRKSTKSLSSINDNENPPDLTNQSLSQQTNLSTESYSTKTTDGETSLPNWFEQTHDRSKDNQERVSPLIIHNSNSEIVSEPFVTVTHRRRVIKERRQEPQPVPRFSRLPPPMPSNINEKRRIPSTTQNGIGRSTTSNKSDHSSIIKEENDRKPNIIPSESTPPPPPPPLSSSSSIVNPVIEQSVEKQQTSPHLSSHSSSSSLSSSLKRQAKIPPVVFLNKSIDIELNDVSFGFDLDSTTLDQPSPDSNNRSSITEQEIENTTNPSMSPSNEPIQVNDMFTQKSHRKYPQRTNRGPQFYSGSDIRPQQHRTYPTQQPMPQSSYIDPLLLLHYNQRLASYSQQLAYMNLLRTQYLPPQSQYIYLPTTYPTTAATHETEPDEENNQTSTDQVQLIYATPTGQIYFPPSVTKKSYDDSEQIVAPIPTVYPTAYPSQYFYPSQVQHVIPSSTAYFQPIPSASSVTETNDIDRDDDHDENSTNLDHPKRQQSSSDIMSTALHLVYSQQRRNAQTDRFNLDDLTAYLAMKWTDAVDHYVQGDSRILLADEQ